MCTMNISSGATVFTLPSLLFNTALICCYYTLLFNFTSFLVL